MKRCGSAPISFNSLGSNPLDRQTNFAKIKHLIKTDLNGEKQQLP